MRPFKIRRNDLMSSHYSPVKVGSTLILDQVENYQQADFIAYQRLIGKLMYLSYRTRQDITIVVGQLSRHNSDPRAGHLCIAKYVLRYLKGMITLGIKWGKDLAGYWLGGKYVEFGIMEYIESSYAGDLEDKKSITGYYFFLEGAIVTWCSIRQCTVLISTSEAKYMAVS